MKIAAIRLHLVECRLPEPQGNARQFIDRRAALLVEVRSDEGLGGWGETWHSPPAAWTIIETALAPAILGQDPMEYQRLWAAMHEPSGTSARGRGSWRCRPSTWRSGTCAAARSASRSAGCSGGPIRTRVPAYASGPYLRPGRDPYRAYRREAERMIAPGFRAMKMKIGVDPGADGRAASAVRKVVGPDIILLADANQGYTVRPAIEAGRQLETEGFAWLEEPVAPDDVEGYAHVAGALGLAVVGGRGARRGPRVPVLLRAERPRRRAARPRDRRRLHRDDAHRGPRRGLGGAGRPARLGHGAEPLRVAPALRRAARLPEPHAHAVSLVRVRPVAEPAPGASGARRRSARTAWWRSRKGRGSGSRSTRGRSSRISCAAARSAGTELRPGRLTRGVCPPVRCGYEA